MKKDDIKQFLNLKAALLQEKATIEARLAQINRALEADGGLKLLRRVAAKPKAGRRRFKNELSLKAAVLKATTGKALTKPEILAAIDKLGYRFNTQDPMNSLNTVLYTGKTFKNVDGKFSPAR